MKLPLLLSTAALLTTTVSAATAAQAVAPAAAGTIIPMSRRPGVSDRVVARVASKHASGGSAKRRSVDVSMGDVPYMGQLDQFWNIPVTLGKKQSLLLCFDTGSADIWVRGKNCVSEDTSCSKGRPYLDVSDKTQFTATGKKYSIWYADGGSNGTIYEGAYTVGGIAVPNGYFGVSTLEDEFDEIDDAGIIGFAFPSLSVIAGVTNKVSPITALKLSSFGLYLQNAADGDKGDLTLNGVNPARFTGSFNYVPLSSTNVSHWQISSQSATLTVGKGKPVPFTQQYSILDSGTSELVLGEKEANAVLANFKIDANGFVNCNAQKTGPDVTLTFNGKPYVIPASEYIIGGTRAGVNCTVAVVAGNPIHPSIIGAPFLRQWYTQHDISGKRVGFAKAVHK